MLDEKQLKYWEALEPSLKPEQWVWLAKHAKSHLNDLAASAPGKGKLNIFFATETGNSKTVSQQLAKAAKKEDWKTQATAVSKLSIEDLAKVEGPVVFVASTHGEGDPPETAVAFFARLKAASGTPLAGVQYATLGLGDSAYAEFCGFARKLDAELNRLGATPLIPRVELDVDFVGHVPNWLGDVVEALPIPEGYDPSLAVSFSLDDEEEEEVPLTGKGYSRLEPVTGRIAEIVNMNDHGSRKETYHIEIESDDLPFYRPGDAAGIVMAALENGEVPVPRLYSIASSPAVHGNRLHLTVVLAWHLEGNGEKGFGLCSRYLADLKEGDEVKFYIHQNQLFRLPSDQKDIIMVGPGTGIAPFRSFVAERADRGADGRNWLFFGDQHAHLDFLYQQEWIDYVETDALHRIDLAFSRDQEEKIYVQDCMKQKADELMAWLDGGAYFYVCGTKDPMSRDVEATLLDIIAAHKGGPSEANAYLSALEEEGRYVKDVY